MNGPRVVVAGRWLGEGAAAAPGTPEGGPSPQRPGADPALRAPGNGAPDPGGGDSPAFEAVVSSQPNPDPGSRDSPATLRALGAVASGITSARPGAHCSLVPLGPGPVFDEAAAGAGSFTAVRVPTGAPSTAPAGEAVRAALAGGGTVVVEGGHNAAVDCGFGFLTALTGISVREGDDLARSLPAALDRAERIVADSGADLVAAASTTRPLVGLDSVLAVAPGPAPRPGQDPGLTALLSRELARRPRSRTLLAQAAPGPSAGAGPASARGSGSGGGVAAVIAAIGGRIVDTGPLLVALGPLRRHLEEADLLVACEPDLSFPALAESCLDAITAAAAPWAIPVVALAARSTLSAHERAQWGLHGVFATDGALGPGAAGARIARTWLPAADGPDSAARRKRVG